MRSGRNWPNKPKTQIDWEEVLVNAILGVLLTAGIVVLVLAISGCTSTVRPVVVESRAPSWDGSSQNSGLVGFDAAGNAILTPRAEARYFYLCELYGWKFHPPACGGETVLTSSNTFLLDPLHLSEFATMNRWKKEGVTTK